jgi:predicted ABC-type ATPase
MPDTEPPEIFVLSGPNGAGKSTTAMVLLPEELAVRQFVNADMIAAELSPFSPESSAFEAGRLMLQRIRSLRTLRRTFAFETTLATRSYVTFLRDAQLDGFVVHVIYVWLSSVALAQSRVAARVRQGGHHISPEIVERRYWRGLRNFFSLFVPLVNTWTLFDNSGDEVRMVARGAKDRSRVIYQATVYDIIVRSANHETV